MEYLLPVHCVSKNRLDGKTVVITGGSSGLGKETALQFYKIGARVVLACRSESKTQDAIDDIKRKTKDEHNVGELVFKHLELSSLESVRKCAKEILITEKVINILVNNAGIALCPKTLSENGIELHFATNHLGHYLLTLLLLPRILKSAPARIINVSSLAHTWSFGKLYLDDINMDKNYSPNKAYGRSKLANILFAAELVQRLNGTGVTVYAVNPGFVHTDIGRFANRSVFAGASWLYKIFTRVVVKTPGQGAQTTLYCALDDNCAHQNGLYYSNCKITEPSPSAKDEINCKKLWNVSCSLVNLNQQYNPFEPDM